MSNVDQLLARYREGEGGPVSDPVADDVEMDLAMPQSVYHQVSLTGPMHLQKHLLNAEYERDNILTGSTLDDEISGDEKDDILLGKEGADLLNGYAGNDLLFGDEGRDVLLGGDGDDTLDGGAGSDRLDGEAGNDIVSGGAGADVLEGGGGDDVLTGGPGADLLMGDEGNDTYRFEKGDGQDVIFNSGRSGFSSGDDTDRDRVAYGFGIHSDQLWFQRSGQDLTVTNIETGDSQRVQDWFEDAAFHIDEFHLADGKRLLAGQVEPLVTAMASMIVPAIGSHHFSSAYQTILSPVLAQSWQ